MGLGRKMCWDRDLRTTPSPGEAIPEKVGRAKRSGMGSGEGDRQGSTRRVVSAREVQDPSIPRHYG
jgi:hypothetical protein